MSEDRLYVVTNDQISPERERLGRLILWGAGAILVAVALAQVLAQAAATPETSIAALVETWRPTLYAWCLFITAYCASLVIRFGERGKRQLFIAPATLFVVSMVIFPLIFAGHRVFRLEPLLAVDGRNSTGSTMSGRCGAIRFYWNALGNMVLLHRCHHRRNTPSPSASR
jgi:multiple sugar transport system permease protein